MVIKTLNEINPSQIPGHEGMSKRVVIGKADGSNEISLRYFCLEVGESSPHHAHDFPHLVKIEAGQGCVTDGTGNNRNLNVGDYVYVDNKEPHCFKNTGDTPFEFICIVPDRGEA